MTVVNWGLIKHPMNWVIVILMVMIAGMAAHQILMWCSSDSTNQ